MSIFSIRRAEIGDAEAIARVHITSWQESYRELMPDSVLDTLSLERRSRQWKYSLEDPADVYHLALVAETGGKVVGFANYGRERENNPDYSGELYAIYILKEFHGNGIGRNLMHYSAMGLLEINLFSMLVWVLAENPARKFYEKLGGKYLREKSIEFGGQVLMEKAYGWKDVHALLEKQ